MTSKTFLPVLLLLAFFTRLSAQTTPANNKTVSPPAFESVSFSTVQGSIIITCEAAENLVNLEFMGNDTYFKFEWENELPSHYFPMKLNLKPGKVVVRYKMRGQKDKVVELNIAADDAVKLTL